MTDEPSLEGWSPTPNDAQDLAQIIDRAFDYRGDVTVVLRDGTERVGYVCNRDRDAALPRLELLEPAAGHPVSIAYADVRTIRFTGKDTASGKSYTVWLERKAKLERERRERR